MANRWIILPGTLCTRAVFDPFLDRMNVPMRDRILIPVDRATVEDYQTIFAETIHPSDIVCGFSLGAHVVAHNVHAIAKAGAQAAVLLSVNPLPDPPDFAPGRKAMRDQVLAGRARDIIQNGWNSMSVDRGEKLVDTVSDMAVASADLINAQTNLALTRPGAVDVLADTELPMVFVTGSEDLKTPPDQAKKVAYAAKNGFFKGLDGLGHFALMEDPRRMASTVNDGLSHVLGLNWSNSIK